jgi:hypothetical protein
LSGSPFVCIFTSQRGLTGFSKCKNLYIEYAEPGMPLANVELEISEIEDKPPDINMLQTVFSPDELLFKRSGHVFNERVAYTWGQMFATDLVNETVISSLEDDTSPVEICGIVYNETTGMRLGIARKPEFTLIDIDSDRRILCAWVGNSTDCVHRFSHDARIRLEQWGYLSDFWTGVRDMLDVAVE